MKKVKSQPAIMQRRALIRLKKSLLKSLQRVEQAFSAKGIRAIAEFREKLNAL